MHDAEKIEIDRGTVKRWLAIVHDSKTWPYAINTAFIDEMLALLRPPRCPAHIVTSVATSDAIAAGDAQCILGAGHHQYMAPHPRCCDDPESDPIHQEGHRMDSAFWRVDQGAPVPAPIAL